jgi:hypothetical protein
LITNNLKTVPGRLGLVAYPTWLNLPFAAGTRDLATVIFQVSPDVSVRSIPLWFSDDVFQRLCMDVSMKLLPAVYKDGEVRVGRLEYEAGLTPASGGAQPVRAPDWVRSGRLVAGLEELAAVDFQRADCAPRETRGDGVLSVADWVQAGRYYFGLDRPRAAGGPSQPSGSGVGSVAADEGLGAGRSVTLISPSAEPGAGITLPVRLLAQGGENAWGFSLRFDPAKMVFVNAKAGPGLNDSSVNRNTNGAAQGAVGVTMALAPGESLPPGSRDVVLLKFRMAAGASGSAGVAFEDSPVWRQVADVEARVVSAVFRGATIELGPAVAGARKAILVE